MSTARLLFSFSALFGLLVGCSDDESPAPAPGANVGPEGGVVVSDDGRARLTIEPGALAAPTRIAIFAAPTSAVPGAVAGTSFRYEVSSPVAFKTPQLFEISTTGPLAPKAAARIGVVQQAASLENEPTCDPALALSSGVPLETRWYLGDKITCPSRCEQLDAKFFSSPIPDALLCGPKDLIRIRADRTCPAPYIDAGLVEYWSYLMNTMALARACQLPGNIASPSMTGGGSAAPCIQAGGGFHCLVGVLSPSGPTQVVSDTVKPTVTLERGADSVDPVTSELVLNFTVKATDDVALHSVDVREITGFDIDLENPSLEIASTSVYSKAATGVLSTMNEAATVAWPPSIVGPRYFFGRARDHAGNVIASFPLTVTRSADVTPPSVSLTANPASVMPPGTSTLTAIASDDIGVVKVEFYKGTTLVATDSTPTDGFTATASFAAGESGNVEVTARAYDAANNVSTSAPLVISLLTVGPNDRFVSPTGVDGSAGTKASPLRTIAHATSVLPAGATIWLENGAYDEGLITLPAGAALRAVNSGMVDADLSVSFAGSGAMSGVNFDNSYIEATTGTVQLSAITVKSGGSCGNGRAGINAFGTAKITLDSGGDPDFSYYRTPSGAGFAILRDSGELTVNGGKIVEASPHGCSGGAVFTVRNSSKLTLHGVKVESSPGDVLSLRDTAVATLRDSTIDGGTHGVLAADQTSVSLFHSTITNIKTNEASPGILCGVTGGSETCTIVLDEDSTISQCGKGIVAMTFATPNVTVKHSKIVDNLRSAVQLPRGGTATFIDATLTGNETITDGNPSGSAIDVSGSGFEYHVTMRDSRVSNNGFNGTSYAGGALLLGGTVSSTFDFGKKGSPGNNVFQGNRNPGTLQITSPAGATVFAAGNTWDTNEQNADATGKYVLGADPCQATTCNVTTGSGKNYAISSGATLRLVDP